MRRSESNQSITRPMWDSSDPTRNPSPLPLPDNHAPMSGIRTQSKISAAHKRLTSTTSSRSLTQLVPEEESPTMSLYDLVSTIHTNLEILLKRSQNNARDLGRLRGDVKNPQAIEEIKKLLQESSTTHASSDVQDPERRREIETELAIKLDALLKNSANTTEKATNVSVGLSSDGALMAQVTSAAQTAAMAADGTDRVLNGISSMRAFLQEHLPVHIPDPLPVAPLSAPIEAEPVKVSIDTSSLEATVNMLSSEIASKIRDIQQLDLTLLDRKAELANLESRTSLLKNNLTNLVNSLAESRAAEMQRQKDISESKDKELVLRQKKSTLGRRALMPLGPSVDRRIVSLSNVDTPPMARKQAPPQSPAPSIAPPLRHESPFSQAPVTLANTIDQENEPRKSPHRPMQLTLRQTPPRRTSWSRRVSQIFTSGGNKENSLLNSVHEDSTSSRFGKQFDSTDEKAHGNIGRGFAASKDFRGSVRSFRSFSSPLTTPHVFFHVYITILIIAIMYSTAQTLISG
ncbi:protein of unknown function [Taphrina deformans PYCC 5710]|uniref:Uncharacterized protein n=1 Tax=Taphrina deformans (strain PYCC 5710 / ATCC 11124 / CBS 356.35 / IMI 108563 / JCM 9778 / NBRC 8474) TaxID=1097556 RepID=R4XEC1_TAPDE|nr:protein of unknown function [Taphrina deformans PYCC 5710]|eukprot:CCG81712.1 protein of unknown function [Taphrina deformans PYCC 5710]